MVRQLDTAQKEVIKALFEENLTCREISARIGCSHVAVSKVIKKIKVYGDIERKIGSGKKKITSPREDRILIKMCLSDRKKTSRELSMDLRNNHHVKVSARTVRRRLQNVGLMARRPQKKPPLSTKMRVARLKWAMKYRNWTENDWKRVIFTDESKINLNQSDGIHYVRRRRNETNNPQCILAKHKFPVSVMVWGGISFFGTGDLVCLTGSMNGDSYIEVIREGLIPSIERLFPVILEPIFQDDSAPCHRAARVSFFFLRYSYFLEMSIKN